MLIVKVAQRGVPWQSQLLPFSPVRIPLLAPHMYHGAVYNTVQRMDQIGGKGRCFAIVTGLYERIYIAYVVRLFGFDFGFGFDSQKITFHYV